MNISWRHKTASPVLEQAKAIDELFDSTSKLTSTSLATKTIVTIADSHSDTTSTIEVVMTQPIKTSFPVELVSLLSTNGSTSEVTITTIGIGSDGPDVTATNTRFDTITLTADNPAQVTQPTSDVQSDNSIQMTVTLKPDDLPDKTGSNPRPSVTSNTIAGKASEQPGSLTPAATASITPSVDPSIQLTHKSMTIPIVASIVPLLTIIIICTTLYICWRRRKNLCQKEQDDLEREAVWIVSPNNLSSSSENGERQEKTNVNGGQDKPLTILNPPDRSSTLQVHKKSRPGPLVVPPKNHSHQNTTPRARKEEINLEDPFLTPTNQTTFGDTNTHLGSEEFHESRIGLAVTTPENQNNSTASLADSLRTVIQHTSRRLSNPFRDPTTSTINVASNDQSPKNNELSSGSDSQLSKQSNDNAGDKKGDPAGLTRSNTPPEELARRWIEVLRMEAAQAQEAAVEAARQAQELKRRNGGSSNPPTN